MKGLIVWDASQEADCPVAILDVRENGTTEEAIIAAFLRRGPTYSDGHCPTAQEMAKFKELLFIDVDEDPKWHIRR